MKKRKKTTDSILKDIFEPLRYAEEKVAHPLSDFSSQPASANRLEAFIKDNPSPAVAPLPVEELQNKSILFRPETPAEETPSAPEPVVKPILPKSVENRISAVVPSSVVVVSEEKRLRALNTAAVVVGILAFVAASLIFGVIWQASRPAPGQSVAQKTPRTAPVTPQPGVPAASRLVPNPALANIDRLGHQGVLFKNYSVNGNKLMLRGYVANQARLVQFLNAMNGSPYFKNSWISSVRPTAQKNYEFQIYADIQ